MPHETTFIEKASVRSAARPPAHLFLQLLNDCIADAQICFRHEDTETIVGSLPAHRSAEPCEVVVRVHRPRFFTRVLCEGNLGMGEAFMDEDFSVEEGTLHDFLTILLRNRLSEKLRQHPRLLLKIAGTRLVNAFYGKHRNVQRHYDLGDDLFASFLDSTLTYSCGYVQSPDDDLEQLQRNKLDRICRKLRLQPGQHLLDIGCGFGGLLIYAAQQYGVTGIGVTVSKRHCEYGNERIAAAGLSDKMRIEFQDYAKVSGQFDRVVSVGMMEHVPREEYHPYFSSIARVLAPQGMGLVHTIGCNTFKNEHDPFIQKYIFPASHQPRLSEMTEGLERNRLGILDVENIRQHYAATVLGWLQRFRENAHTLDSTKYDATFRRMWEYYFACGIAAARVSDSAVYQVLFTKDHTLPIPLHRV